MDETVAKDLGLNWRGQPRKRAKGGGAKPGAGPQYKGLRFTLPKDVIEKIEALPKGSRSSFVADALRKYFADRETIMRVLSDPKG